VVDQDAGTAFDVTDDVHHFGLVGLRATLVDDRQIDAEGLGHGTGANHTTDIGGDDHQVLETLSLDVVDQYRRAVDVVDRHVEEALDLVSVQVASQDAVDADDIEHVGYDLGADRHSGRAWAAILTGITEIGDHCSDTRRRGAAEGI